MQISISRLDNSDKIFHFSGSSLNDNWLFQKFHLKSTPKDIHACLMQEWFVRLRNIISALNAKEGMQQRWVQCEGKPEIMFQDQKVEGE